MPTAPRLGNWAIAFIVFWACVTVIVILALVFASLAFNSSQPYRPHMDLTRRNIVAFGNTHLRKKLTVDGDTSVRSLALESLNYQSLQIIAATGTFELSSFYSSYRIDTPGTNTISLVLPPVKSAPGHTYIIFVSQQGADNTVEISVQSGEFGSTHATSTDINPVYTFPLTPSKADAVRVANDSLNTWYFV